MPTIIAVNGVEPIDQIPRLAIHYISSQPGKKGDELENNFWVRIIGPISALRQNFRDKKDIETLNDYR